MTKFVDKSGKKFRHLLVLERAPDTIEKCGRRRVTFLCECDCGRRCVIRSNNISTRDGDGKNISCGCVRNMYNRMKIIMHEPMEGKKFGKLLVIKEIVEKFNGQKHFYLCKCECGVEKIISSQAFKYGQTRSCGCSQIEFCKEKKRNNSKQQD